VCFKESQFAVTSVVVCGGELLSLICDKDSCQNEGVIIPLF
jgi:hypothetical protein